MYVQELCKLQNIIQILTPFYFLEEICLISFFKKNLFILLFIIFGCIGSSLLRVGFL